jgi:hypothetical protein
LGECRSRFRHNEGYFKLIPRNCQLLLPAGLDEMISRAI